MQAMATKDTFGQDIFRPFFMENVNPIYLFSIYISQFAGVKDCVKQKKRNTSYNQCFLNVANELSSNLNNEFCSILVQNTNFKL